MSNYLNKNFVGDRVGKDWGTTLWPSIRTSPGWGNCAYVARGDRRPCGGVPNFIPIGVAGTMPMAILPVLQRLGDD